MIIADTDVLIDYILNKGAGADVVAREADQGRLATTAVTWFELHAGSVTPKEKRTLDDLFTAVPVLPLDLPAAARAAAVHRDLLKRGQTIGMADSLIAGIALHYGAVLLTRNRVHFERVPGLELVDL